MDQKEAKFEIIFEGRFTSEEGVYWSTRLMRK